MTEKKSKSQIKREAIQGEQVWTKTDARISVPDEYTIVHESIRKTEAGSTIRLIRFLGAGWGLECKRKEGAAQITTKVAFSSEAMKAIVDQYNELHEKPIHFEMTYEVHPVKPKKKK